MNKIESHENVKSNIRYPNYWKQYELKKLNSDNYNIPLIENYNTKYHDHFSLPNKKNIYIYT